MTALARSQVSAIAIDPLDVLLAQATGEWCLVRWSDGVTVAVLRDRGDSVYAGAVDPVPGVSFCGPLAPCSFSAQHGLGSLGFPSGSVGAVARFETRESAASCAEQTGDHICIDIATPVDALHFSVDAYSHWNGVKRTVYDGGDFNGAFAAQAQFVGLLATRPGNNYIKVTLECRPIPDRLGPNRPTQAQILAMNSRAISLEPSAEERVRLCALMGIDAVEVRRG